MTEKQAARPTDDNSLHDEAGWRRTCENQVMEPLRGGELGEALWIIVFEQQNESPTTCDAPHCSIH